MRRVLLVRRFPPAEISVHAPSVLQSPSMVSVQNTGSKEGVNNVEKVERGIARSSGLSEEEEEFLASFPSESEAKIYRKV